ncbi:hypothetical protein, partial [Pseudomonas frederiksbergensis]|uniref:hypothetical protein n=1 Tax=Pseudomonas frederiksbergensis TaxID=104087 RepID=UPI001F33DBF1
RRVPSLEGLEVGYFMAVILRCSLTGQAVATYRNCIGMSVLTKMPNYVRPFAYKQLAWISFFHGAPTFRCSLFRGDRAGVLWQNQQCPNYVSSWQK